MFQRVKATNLTEGKNMLGGLTMSKVPGRPPGVGLVQLDDHSAKHIIIKY